MTYDDLEPDLQEAVRVWRQAFADHGYELTPAQFVEALVNIRKRLEADGVDPSVLFDARWELSESLEPPPYDGWFETIAEAGEFRERVESCHGIRCLVVRDPESDPARPRWRVVEAPAPARKRRRR